MVKLLDPIAAQWLHVAGLPMESSPALC